MHVKLKYNRYILTKRYSGNLGSKKYFIAEKKKVFKWREKL